MGVGRGHHHTFRPQTGCRLDLALRFVKHLAINANAIDSDNGEPGSAVVQCEAAGVQFIVNMGRRNRVPPAHDAEAQLGRDVAGRGARLKYTSVGRGSRR